MHPSFRPRSTADGQLRGKGRATGRNTRRVRRTPRRSGWGRDQSVWNSGQSVVCCDQSGKALRPRVRMGIRAVRVVGQFRWRVGQPPGGRGPAGRRRGQASGDRGLVAAGEGHLVTMSSGPVTLGSELSYRHGQPGKLPFRLVVAPSRSSGGQPDRSLRRSESVDARVRPRRHRSGVPPQPSDRPAGHNPTPGGRSRPRTRRCRRLGPLQDVRRESRWGTDPKIEPETLSPVPFMGSAEPRSVGWVWGGFPWRSQFVP